MTVPASILSMLIIMMAFINVVHSAEYYPFVLFNGGKQDSTRRCTENEWAYIDTEIEKAYSGRRSLENGSRSLFTVCKKPLSNYFGKGCAAQTTGEADRRILRGLATNGTICDVNTRKFNSTLNTISTKVSSTCKAMIGARSFSCRQQVECDIHRIELWNADTDKVNITDFPATGGSICSSMKANFNAVSNFVIGDVYFNLMGSNGYRYDSREWQIPYYLYGNVGTNVFGKNLDAGVVYTLFVYSALDPSKGKTVSFNVTTC